MTVGSGPDRALQPPDDQGTCVPGVGTKKNLVRGPSKDWGSNLWVHMGPRGVLLTGCGVGYLQVWLAVWQSGMPWACLPGLLSPPTVNLALCVLCDVPLD